MTQVAHGTASADHGGMRPVITDGREIRKMMDAKGISFGAFKSALMIRKKRKKMSDEAVYLQLRGEMDPSEALLYLDVMDTVKPDKEPSVKAVQTRADAGHPAWPVLIDAARSMGPTVVRILKDLSGCDAAQLDRVKSYLEGVLDKQ